MAPKIIRKGSKIFRLLLNSKGWLRIVLKRIGRAGSSAIELGLHV